jgi:minor extracellular serine protease Vpr
MKNKPITIFITLFLLMAVIAGSGFAATAPGLTDSHPRRDFTEAPQTYTQTEYAIVTFKDPPAASYEGGLPGLPRTKPINGKLDPNSPPVRGYVKHLNNVHANYRSWLARNARSAQVVGESVYTLNALTIRLNNNSKDKLKLGPGVRSVEYSFLYQPTMNVSAGVISATDLWPLVGGRENAGAGIKVGIIDSGIDETHEFFDCKTGIVHKSTPAEWQAILTISWPVDACGTGRRLTTSPARSRARSAVLLRQRSCGITTCSPASVRDG